MSAKLLHLISCVVIAFASVKSLAVEKPMLPIKTWMTKSGTPVFYVNEPELPIIDIQVVFEAGSARDSQPGIAKLTNETLSAGTVNKSVDAIAAAFESVGALYSSAVSRDMAVVALRTLSDPDSFQPALAIFSDVLTHPNFPNTEFLRIQKQLLRSLEEQEELPASIASKAFYRTVYDDTPYGHPISGDQGSVSKLTAEDLKIFYNNFYTQQNCLIAIVGDINEARAREITETLSRNLKQGTKRPPLSINYLTQQAQKKHIDFPSSQTNVLMGQVGIMRNDPRYFTVVVGNYILGGGSLTSRLFNQVRDKRGLAYTVRSQFSALKERGPIMIELQTRNSEAKNAINVVQDTVNEFLSTGPSRQELAAAKKNLTQGFVLRLASNSAIISQLISIGFYHLPLNYLDTYTSNILEVTDQEIKDVFKKILHPESMVTITVGKEVDGQKTLARS